jgi:uncharacterized protein (TIGR02284 family)
MSTDKKVTKDLMQTLEDGRKGFAEAADKLTETDRPEIASTFRTLSAQRNTFYAELEQLAANYGDDDLDESGSLAAAVHRGWMSLKDALTGSDPKGVLDVSEQGEDHAVKEYEKALDEDISPDLRNVVQRQFADVKAAHDQVRGLRDAFA